MPTDLSPTDLEAYVRQRAPQVAKDIRKAARTARVEADLVAEVEQLLKRFAQSFDVALHLERERTLINGRADAVYNRFVVEYEPPGSLQRSNLVRTNKHAIEQVQNYIEGLERLDRHRKERLAGVVVDGSFYIFLRFRDERWRIDDPLPVDTHSTETFLRYLLSLSTELALTPENLVRDFGENSDTARRVVPAIYQALKATDSPKVDVLFRQWQRQFREVSGYDPKSGQLDPALVGRLYAIRDRSPDFERLFFTIHTYYAAFIKILALQVGHYYLMPKMGSGLAAAADYDSHKLQAYLVDMEHGGLFAQLGIRNFLEGDFFGWYLDIWDDALDAAFRRLIGDLANYSLVTLDVDPEETRDLLKQLYQNLMPKKLRHALGEYYTPDWLAERVLNQLGYDGDPKKRLLDPACGSGTFPVLAIKRVRLFADEKMLPPSQVLEQILNNIVGFDLNPLAVISARTNYLLALGDLLPHRKGEISIPVYLADSILTPTVETTESGQLSFLDKASKTKVRHPGFSFKTAVGQFIVPRSLVDAQYIDQLADLLEESVGNGMASGQFRSRLLKSFPLREPNDEAEIKIAVELYEQLTGLDKQGINGIWARIIKNAFAPLFSGRFDYLAGNPPWVNWESLPQDYRQETKPLWERYGLYVYQGQLGKMREGKKDISMLMTYVGMDQYLLPKGKLGFIITQSVFKTTGAGQGFRRFSLGDKQPVGVIHVDDMSAIKPFEGAANRTAVMMLQKGSSTRYPVPYTVWKKVGHGQGLREGDSLAEVLALTKRYTFVAEPVDSHDLTSAWLSGRPHALTAVRKIIGASYYQARMGTNTGGANGVFWLQLIDRRPDGLILVANLTEGSRRKVETLQMALEPDLVYPLIRGRDVGRWLANPAAFMLVTQDRAKQREGLAEQVIGLRYPKTYSYLLRFKDILAERPDRKYYPDGSPFYTLRNVADYTFAPYKVVWPEVASDLRAAVIGSSRFFDNNYKVVVPDHTIIMVACNSKAEAHFVCAMLNCSPAGFAVRNYIVLHPDPHILKRVCIPQYDEANALHRQLGQLSKLAHKAATAGDIARVQSIESEIDTAAANLWGLTTDELKEIQASLRELS